MKYLYKISNTVNEKLYVGVTINPKRRWRQHCNLEKTHCKALKAAMEKYGKTNFKLEILCYGDNDIIDELEVIAIKTYNSQSPNGYNITLGGEGTLYYKWKEEWNNLLGTMTDRDLSKLINIPHPTIGDRRRALNITDYMTKVKVNWSDYNHLFGKVTDKYISELSGVGVSCVQQQRLKRGIKLREGKRDASFYTIEDWMLPVLKDTSLRQKDVSQVLGLSVSVVQKWRYDNNIGKFTGRGLGRKVPITDELMSDIYNTELRHFEVARRNDVGSNWVANKRKTLGVILPKFKWTDEKLNLLWSNQTDKEISKRFGIGEECIRCKRREIGVPKRSATKNPFLTEEPYFSEIINSSEEAIQLADKWGVPVHQITALRRKYKSLRPNYNKRTLASLTKEEWLYIRFLYESGIRYSAIVYNLALEVARPDSLWAGLSGKSYSKITGFSPYEVKKRSNKV